MLKQNRQTNVTFFRMFDEEMGYCAACAQWTREQTESTSTDYECPKCRSRGRNHLGGDARRTMLGRSRWVCLGNDVMLDDRENPVPRLCRQGSLPGLDGARARLRRVSNPRNCGVCSRRSIVITQIALS